MNAIACPYIILLSGTPGTGKTTISDSLNRQFNRKIFHMGRYILENKLYSVERGEECDIKTINTDRAAKSSAIEILSKMLDSEVIIIDSHYSDILLDGFFDIQDQPEFDCAKHYYLGLDISGIVCRCDPRILKHRLSKREYSESKINENLQAEILSESTQNMMEVLPKEKILEINTTEASVTELVTVINQLINHKLQGKVFYHKKLKPIGDIDWISLLNESNELDLFFKNDYGESIKYTLDELGNLKDQKEVKK